MSRALLEFNPESHGIGGDTLLFGVAIPSAPQRSGPSELEELDLASKLLEARSGSQLAALLRHITNRASAIARRRIDPQVQGLLLNRFARAAVIVRTGLQSDRQTTGLQASPEVIFGAELEGLSPEDQEFEIARRFVRLTFDASRNAALAAQGVAPDVIASNAERLAARRLAPGLLRVLGPPPMGFRARHRARLGQ
jgi:hypothetical protein